MDSDSDLLDDCFDELDLDGVLDEAFEEVQGGEPNDDSVEGLVAKWKPVIDKDEIIQQAIVSKPFSRSYVGSGGKKTPKHLPPVHSTLSYLLRAALVQSKVCRDEEVAKDFLNSLLNDERTSKHMEKITGGYRHRLRKIFSSRLTRDSDFDKEQFPNAAKAFL